MYNVKFLITAGIIFAVLFTTPFWIGGVGKDKYTRPDVVKPVNEKDCVEPIPYMRAEHMQLLNLWRDEALRKENRTYISSTGKKWEISLQKTCLKCHNNSTDFCDKCHVSNSVYPYCWTCHILPKGSK